MSYFPMRKGTRARNPFIRMVHPIDDLVERQAAEEFAARLAAALPPLSSPKTEADARPVAASREQCLEDLLLIMRDKNEDVQIRIDAAEAALTLKDRQPLAIEIVNYADVTPRVAAAVAAGPADLPQ